MCICEKTVLSFCDNARPAVAQCLPTTVKSVFKIIIYVRERHYDTSFIHRLDLQQVTTSESRNHRSARRIHQSTSTTGKKPRRSNARFEIQVRSKLHVNEALYLLE